MSLADEQRSRLRRAKLTSLVRDRGVDVTHLRFADGPTLTSACDGATLWAISEEPTPAQVAGAVLSADRAGVDRVVLFVDEFAGTVTRWAGWFRLQVEVRQVTGATSSTVPPDPFPDPVPPVDDAGLRRLMLDAGADVVVEHGVVRGEVLGLEVARLVAAPHGDDGGGGVVLEAGVGRFDREAAAAMHRGEHPAASLRRVVDQVRRHRVAGAGSHPLALLARERWLRRELLDRPDLVGAADLHPVETTVVRSGVRDRAPAAASGSDPAGRPVVVVCSTGADLALVPVAADTRAAVAPDARLLLAVPHRDVLAPVVRLAGLLQDPAEVVGVPAPWEAP